jgi:uncharacterized protein (TIGR02594 family)
MLEAPTVQDVEHRCPWMMYAFGENYHRVKRSTEAAAPNPHILAYLRSVTLEQSLASTDHTQWCAAFVNWCLQSAGFYGTSSAAASSFIAWGQPLGFPEWGCIAVFRVMTREGVRMFQQGKFREHPKDHEQDIHHHVGFFVGRDGGSLLLLGGNQSRAVRISKYPLHGHGGREHPSLRFDLVACRWPAGHQLTGAVFG